MADPVGPQLTEGSYVGEAAVSGDDAYEMTEPFPVTIVPATLLD